MSCCEACIQGGPCVTYGSRYEQAAEHARLIVDDIRDDDVRELARIIAASLGPAPQGSSVAEATAVWRYLRDSVRYVREHGEVWTRTLDLLAMGAGDCDDLAGAAAALLGALGWTVALAYGDQHVSVLAVSPDGDVRQVDATLDAPPWATQHVPDDVYVIDETTGDVLTWASGAGGGPCGAVESAPQTVPRDDLAACLALGKGLTSASQAAAMEIGRRAWYGHGDQLGLADVTDYSKIVQGGSIKTLWIQGFIDHHGCQPIMDSLDVVEALGGDVSILRSAVLAAAATLGWSCHQAIDWTDHDAAVAGCVGGSWSACASLYGPAFAGWPAYAKQGVLGAIPGVEPTAADHGLSSDGAIIYTPAELAQLCAAGYAWACIQGADAPGVSELTPAQLAELCAAGYAWACEAGGGSGSSGIAGWWQSATTGERVVAGGSLALALVALARALA